ncbi:hypothetical protein WK39_28030 [Burkholderia cepacia]|uniref:hypothetical protein n=1 Tax=Burkholderia cepacia complex TaxID=87882 RepID=UPI0007540D3B|nr:MULTISPECIES: hypothetical protein [Burkholderia cepacia complex]KVS50712.1 hypothetical protein WK39_28030 [Burkholderia cepacia]KVS65738.1 hypothetical protein WK40_12340 [Burkholderia cepacia]KWO46504.1 hypothetical protein WT98_21910 [Burkholderia territorii]
MKSTDFPARIPTPFALNGNRNAIPEASQISVTKGAASFNDGFPPLTMTDPLQGGIPPFGKDMNGVLFALSAIARWSQAGGGYLFDPVFAGNQAVGGYPKSAVLLRADLSGFWFNTVDNNTTNPDATDGSAQGWMPLNADWNASSGPGVILNRPALAKVATSGSYADLSGTPTIPAAQVNSDWDATSGVAQILNRPTLATVATSGSYTDLSNQPSIPAAQVNADWNAASGIAQIFNKPTIPAAQVNADWNATSGVAQILNKPSMVASLPVLIIEFGNSAQPNGGRGIDNGTYYQPDCRIGTTAYNSFPYVTNSDGTITVPSGLYLVSGCLQIIAPSTDTYQLPAQMTVAMGMVYKFPGIFQYAARVLPDISLASQSVSGTIGTVVISSVQSWGADWEIWTGFSKVLGSSSQTPLLLQGELSVTQLGSFAPGTTLTSNTAKTPV